MNTTFGIVLLFVLTIAFGILWFVLATWVLVWNINDMLTVGVNFWNVFWSLLAVSTVLGGTTKAATS